MTPFGTFCDLPQLGGSFFDPPNRPTGLPSLTLRCPIVPTEVLNSISERTRNLSAADSLIRDTAPVPADRSCNSAISCSCNGCSTVRTDLFNDLNRVLLCAPPANDIPPVLPPSTVVTEVPPRPLEAPARPPSTLPPRWASSTRSQRTLAIPAPVPEEVPTNFSFGPDLPSAPFRATDLPLNTRHEESSDLAILDAADNASEAPSDSVSHISWDRVSVSASAVGSEWSIAQSHQDWHHSAPRQAEWFFDETNLSTPNRRDQVIPAPDGTPTFDIASQRSGHSRNPILRLGSECYLQPFFQVCA